MSGSNEKAQFQISLSAKGFTNLPMNCYVHDFTFIVGGTRHQCPSFVADFLSPRLCRLRKIDSNICELVIETEDVNNCFSKFLSLGQGSKVCVTDSNRNFFTSICRELLNVELFHSICPFDESDQKCTIVIDELKLSSAIDLDCESQIAFCSSHFYEISMNELRHLRFDLISAIISHPRL
jgi:hypothetical protein